VVGSNVCHSLHSQNPHLMAIGEAISQRRWKKMHGATWKRLLPLILLCICFSVPSVRAAETYYTEGFFQYTIQGESVSLHAYYGAEGEVVIPDHIAALPVTEIEAEAFAGNTTVTKLTIPDTVIQTGENAFSNMSARCTIVNQSEALQLEVPESVVVQEDYPIYVTLEAAPSATPEAEAPSASMSATPAPA
jgi:hypothetical protein